MHILGISCWYHDAAACLVRDGEIVAAAQEERFTRRKHDAEFPAQAAAYCLREAGIESGDLDAVAFYDKPFLKFERLLETYVATAPRGLASFVKAMPVWLKQKIWIPDLIAKELDFAGPVIYPEHHESHAASAFYPSPFDEAAFLTTDGVGEWTTTSYGMGRGRALRIHKELHFPHSLGLLYSAFTYFTGFRVNSGEYKLMGLAPYGEPVYEQTIRDHLIDVKEDGSFKLNMDYFTYAHGLTMTGRAFAELFGGPRRREEAPLTKREMDLARSVQEVTEDVILRMARHAHRETGSKNLCMAGGVALNCVANGRLLREGPFEEIWIQPAAGDAGGAVGAALMAWHGYFGNDRPAGARDVPRGRGKGAEDRESDEFRDGTGNRDAAGSGEAAAESGAAGGGDAVAESGAAADRDGVQVRDGMQGAFLGPSFSDEEVGAFLAVEDIPHEVLDERAVIERTAAMLEAGKVIGWFQGRMEFGPRALGSRSILADPRGRDVQKNVNLKIKFRESFRPFAPSVLRERCSEYFDLDEDSPYMMLVAPVRNSRIEGEGLERRRHVDSPVPAVTHVDGSARVQTVSEPQNPRFYRLLKAFEARTGCPVLVNTSFNVRGEPIVCTPSDAYTCFRRTHMDALVLGRHLIMKDMLPDAERAVFTAEEVAETYGLD